MTHPLVMDNSCAKIIKIQQGVRSDGPDNMWTYEQGDFYMSQHFVAGYKTTKFGQKIFWNSK